MLSAGICDVDLQTWQIPVTEYGYEASGDDILIDDITRLHEDTQATKCSSTQYLPVVGLQHPLDIHRLTFASTTELQFVGVVGVQVDKNIVVSQV